MESMQQAIGTGAVPAPEHRGNGTAPPEVASTAVAPGSRLDGLEIRTDGA
jgi:hypothetical protein